MTPMTPSYHDPYDPPHMTPMTPSYDRIFRVGSTSSRVQLELLTANAEIASFRNSPEFDPQHPSTDTMEI
jgi:hypothetical protein